MTANTERYYVRFKGRVLGPLDHGKTTELIRRGQITRQHELSLDGTQWRAAGEFPRLFATEKSTSAQEEATSATQSQSTTTTPQSISDVWYANFDGDNQGPVAEEIIKSWATAKKLKPDTLIWKAGMADWQTAETVRPEWFKSQTINAIAKSSSEPTGDIQQLADRWLGSLGWIQFLSITGLVLGAISLVATIFFFLGVATSGGSGPVKVMSVVFAFCQLASAVIWFLAAFFLFRYSSRLAVLKYRHSTSDFVAAANAGNLFWKFTGIVVLVWLVSVSAMVLMVYLLGLSIPSMYETDIGTFDIDPAPRNGAATELKE